MYLRLLTRDDLPTCATITALAFENDPFFALLAPKRHEYPEGWHRFNLDRVRQRLVIPGFWGVGCMQKLSTGEEEILGYAFWHRQTTATSACHQSKYLNNNGGVSARLECALLGIEGRYKSWIGNPAMSVPMLRMLAQHQPKSTNGGFPSLPNRWYLQHLAVHPDHQRKGVGQLLVSWGLDRCKEEAADQANYKALPAGLTSSRYGQGLYAKMGFRITHWIGHELGIGGGAVMIWDEENTWVRPVQEKEGIVLKGGNPIDVIYRNEEDEAVVEKETEVEMNMKTNVLNRKPVLELEKDNVTALEAAEGLAK